MVRRFAWARAKLCELGEAEDVTVGILEPGDARSARRLPDPALVLARHAVLLESDPALGQPSYSIFDIGDVPTRYGKRLRFEVLYVRDTQHRSVRVEDQRKVVFAHDRQTKNAFIEGTRIRKVCRGHKRHQLRMIQHSPPPLWEGIVCEAPKERKFEQSAVGHNGETAPSLVSSTGTHRGTFMAEAATTNTSLAQYDTRFFGHPRGLATLFFTEMWERYSFYGTRALLILYMTHSVATGALGMSTMKAGAIYGFYTATVYLLSLPGGWFADRIVGQRKAVLIGGILIACGDFCLATPGIAMYYAGLGLLMIGTGLLKPNVSTMVDSFIPREIVAAIPASPSFT